MAKKDPLKSRGILERGPDEIGEPHLPAGSNSKTTEAAPPFAQHEAVPEVGSMPVPYGDDDPKFDANALHPGRSR